jgi:hypothetical protein
MHACNLSTREAEAGGLKVLGQPVLHKQDPVSKQTESKET